EAIVNKISEKIELGPTPITDKVLFARPQEYTPFLYKVLRFLETRATTCQAQELVVRISPPLGWIKRKGRTKLEEWKNLTKSKQRVVVASIRCCILDPTKNILDNNIINQFSVASRSYLEKLICKTQTKIRTGTFRPKTCNTQKGGKLFTLAPL